MTGSVGNVLSPGATAQVVVDDLRVRQQPGLNAAIVTTIDSGEVVYLSGPPFSRTVDGLEWRQVLYAPGYAAWPAPTPQAIRGWIATGPEGSAYVALEQVDCPGGDPNLDLLIAMTDWARLHCFGDRELTVEGSVVTGFGGVEPGTFEPEWLAHPHAAAGAISNGRQGFFFHQPPEAEREQLAEGQQVRVTGHFDDPAAAMCAMATGVEGTPEPDAIAVLYCRERFVASAVEVIAP